MSQTAQTPQELEIIEHLCECGTTLKCEIPKSRKGVSHSYCYYCCLSWLTEFRRIRYKNMSGIDATHTALKNPLQAFY
jgi:hypothetical protein